MASSMCVATLRDLREGCYDMDIIVKVDRIITRWTFRYPYGPDHPMIEQEDINVVVFDESGQRVFVVLDKPDVIAQFRHLLAEQRLLRVSNFHILGDDELNSRTFYIKLTMASRMEHLIRSESLSIPKLPKHSFDLMTIAEVNQGFARQRGLVDVAGFVVAVYESGMEGLQDISKREVVVVLEDTGVLATSAPTMLTCVFHGQSADVVLQDYGHAPKEGPLFAVIHYAISTNEEDPALCSYHDASRVFFNPQFPELMTSRQSLVERLNKNNESHLLTLHAVKRIVDIDDIAP